MKRTFTTEYYHKNSEVVAFGRIEYSTGYWSEKTYDLNGNSLTFKDSEGNWYEHTYDNHGNESTYKDSNGYHEIKNKRVTKEEFGAFVNGTPEYTMEELTERLGHNFKIKK